MYAHLTSGSIDELALRPHDLIRIADGAKVLWSDYITTQELAACGWFQVVEPARPAITDTQTFGADTIEVVAGAPTRVYHVRNKTQAELDAEAAAAADQQARDQAKAAVTQINTFLAIAPSSLTNAQVRDEVILLSRIAKQLIKDSFH